MKYLGIGLVAIVLSCSPKFNTTNIGQVQHSYGRVTFVPKHKYYIKDCLKGDYFITKKSNGLAITYFNNKGKIYQQAILGYDSYLKEYIVSGVEMDYNTDGTIDMLLSINEDRELRLISSDKIKMTDFMEEN